MADQGLYRVSVTTYIKFPNTMFSCVLYFFRIRYNEFQLQYRYNELRMTSYLMYYIVRNVEP